MRRLRGGVAPACAAPPWTFPRVRVPHPVRPRLGSSQPALHRSHARLQLQAALSACVRLARGLGLPHGSALWSSGSQRLPRRRAGAAHDILPRGVLGSEARPLPCVKACCGNAECFAFRRSCRSLTAASKCSTGAHVLNIPRRARGRCNSAASRAQRGAAPCSTALVCAFARTNPRLCWSPHQRCSCCLCVQ